MTAVAVDLPTPVYVDDDVERRNQAALDRADRAVRTAPAAPAAVANAAKPAAKAPAKPAAKPPTRRTAPAAPRADGSVDTVVRFALAQVGDRYDWAASGPNSWDCSGLTAGAYRQIGIYLPHQSEQQRRYGRAVSRSQLRAGDLIFYKGHVSLATSNGMMVHAANARRGVVYEAIYGTPEAYRRIVG